jgi:hypothetical protein
MKSLKLLLIILALLSALGCGAESRSANPPVIEHDRVIFSNGKKVSFESDKTYLQDDIIRPVMGKPVTIIERAFTVEEWNRVIVETKYGYYEDSGVVFRFYDYKGKLLNKTAEYFGSFRQLLMKNVYRLILVQKSGHYDLTDGHILDTDGNEVGTIDQRARAYDAVICKEGDLLLIQYHRLTQGVRFLTVDVYNAEGKLLKTNDFKTGGSYVIEVGERKIPISLPNPQ